MLFMSLKLKGHPADTPWPAAQFFVVAKFEPWTLAQRAASWAAVEQKLEAKIAYAKSMTPNVSIMKPKKQRASSTIALPRCFRHRRSLI